jgi:hypothetical protein
MRKDKAVKTFFLMIFLFPVVVVLAVLAAESGGNFPGPVHPGDSFNPRDLRSAADQLQDNTFRIDIDTITATFDYFPGGSYADCRAVVVFRMRPGQYRPVIHLDPAIRDNTIVCTIRLNGEDLDISDESDVRVADFEGTAQQALEFQRDLAADTVHTLDMSYRLNLPAGYPRFSTEVTNIEGRGNEERFPTINNTHDLARHILTFRVHGDAAFRCIGSGLVEETVSDVQQWTLDTEQEVASYTVMFVLLPEGDTFLEERNIAGVDVRVMAFVGGASIDTAFAMLEQWIPELINSFGPFPMPRGLSIFLVRYGSGMEYYGGTISALWALEHEVFHMYFACSVVPKTYRDTWMNEAIDKWYEYSADPNYAPIPDTYRSNMVSGRSPVSVGFDTRAYDEGAHIMEAVARELGGRDEMIAFLRYVHGNYSFAPFTTFDFLGYLEEYAGVDMNDRFLNWLYMGVGTSAGAGASSYLSKHEKAPDMTPPLALLKKYGIQPMVM